MANQEKLQPVVTPNMPDVFMTGLQLIIAGKNYSLPSIKIPDGFEIQIQASPLNVANVIVGPKTNKMDIFSGRILRPGEWVAYRVQNANKLQALGLAANLVVNLSCEYGG